MQTNLTEVTYPLPQPTYLRWMASFISYVFHPLFISLYVSGYMIFLHPYSFAVFDEKQKLLRFFSIFFITCFLPAFTVFLLWRLKFADSIMLRTQKERIIPYVASIIFFFWAFYVSKNLPGTPITITSFFLGTFLSTSAALMANNYFKISLHALAVGGAATFMVILGIASGAATGLPISIAVILAGIVCSSRLIVSNHYPFEIYWGLIVGIVFQLVAGYIML